MNYLWLLQTTRMFMRKTLISDDYIILIVNIQSNYQITKKHFRMKLYFIYQQKEK